MYRSALTENNLLTDNVAVVTNTPIVIGEYQIEAGEVVRLGYKDGGQNSALGRIYMKLQNSTPVQLHGTIRIQIASPQDIPLATVFEARTEVLDSGADDVTKQIPFNETELNAQVKEDRKIQIVFLSDTNDNISLSDSEITMTVGRALV